MIYDNKKILILFSVVIILLVTILAIFDFEILVKALIGTIILGMVVFIRALYTAEVVPPDVDMDNEDEMLNWSETRRDAATSATHAESAAEHPENRSNEHIS